MTEIYILNLKKKFKYENNIFYLHAHRMYLLLYVYTYTYIYILILTYRSMISMYNSKLIFINYIENYSHNVHSKVIVIIFISNRLICIYIKTVWRINYWHLNENMMVWSLYKHAFKYKYFQFIFKEKNIYNCSLVSFFVIYGIVLCNLFVTYAT